MLLITYYDYSHPVARPLADAFPGLFIDFIKIIRNRKNQPAPRAGENRASSPHDQAKRALTGTAFHTLTPLQYVQTAAGLPLQPVLLYHREMKQFGGIAGNVSWRDAAAWDAAIAALTLFFSADSGACRNARKAARRVRVLIDAIDPLIQEQTAVICPACNSVCCIDRHSSFDLHDLVYAFCLELPLPNYERHRNETDPCQFLLPAGCRLPRHERPFRCTWYICEALIAHMQTLPAKQTRKLTAMFEELQQARIGMISCLPPDIPDRRETP